MYNECMGLSRVLGFPTSMYVVATPFFGSGDATLRRRVSLHFSARVMPIISRARASARATMQSVGRW